MGWCARDVVIKRVFLLLMTRPPTSTALIAQPVSSNAESPWLVHNMFRADISPVWRHTRLILSASLMNALEIASQRAAMSLSRMHLPSQFLNLTRSHMVQSLDLVFTAAVHQVEDPVA